MQERIDALVKRLGDLTEGIRADLAKIKAENPNVDLGPLEARVATLEGLDAEYPPAPQEENPGVPPQEQTPDVPPQEETPGVPPQEAGR
ncbi:hypothetical protein [Streptosporangium longisporum]